MSHRLLNQLRMRVLVYDISMTGANRDQLIVAARAVARDWDAARPEMVRRNTESRRELMKRRVDEGLCSRCGQRPHRAERVSCGPCGKRDVQHSAKLRQSIKEAEDAGSETTHLHHHRR